MEIRFLGAAGTVTGSRHLIDAAGRRVLVDCGLFQGLKALRERNRQPFPVNPRSIDAVVLTHAHLDHSGWLPVLVREGYAGPVYCTAATRDLAAILLADSAHLQEEEAGFANRHGFSRHHPALPLYTVRDAEQAVERLETVECGVETSVAPGVTALLSRVGHIPGAAAVRLTDGGRALTVSGDVGRPGDPLLADPDPPPACDWMLLESTYGDRWHPRVDPADEIAGVVARTAARGGAVLIPAFAVGRAQEVAYHLHRLMEGGRIPRLPVFMDSPMASRAIGVTRAHPEAMRLSPAELAGITSFLRVADTVEESKRIDAMRVPSVVISASGMATGGRVLHHLKAMAPDARNTILFSGYQAAGTRGAQLLAGAREVKVHGGWVEVRAEVAAIEGLSAHADCEELVGWVARMAHPPKRIFLVHGEPAAADALRVRIADRLGIPCTVPGHGDRATLD
ncbi:MAG TPA: MBL fold metallo-hydrolase [Longimicrobium sp.]|nr:MBL fold metallo-hydrolase [Longimicrobium sp.]